MTTLADDVTQTIHQFELKSASGKTSHAALVEQFENQLQPLLGEAAAESRDLQMLVISALSGKQIDLIAALIRMIGKRLKELDEVEMEQLIALSMPAVPVPKPAAVLEQAQRNADLRTRLLQENDFLDAESVHSLYGSSAGNTAALAAKWRKEGKIFGVEHQGKLLHPAFQFSAEGKPKPAIRKILTALGDGMGPWQKAIWFTAANPLLRGRRPCELLDRDPENVVQIAQRLNAPDLF